ncbi:MAG: hypothetical protein ACE5RN_05840 [Nitrosopumilaceae archaeon]
MTRKFINREEKKGLDAKKEVAAEDEWAHLTESDEKSLESKIEKKIEAADAMSVLDRSITFGNEQEHGPKSQYDKIKEEARNAMDAAGNTGQYIRFVNQHIDNQKREIDKIKKIQERFDHEIDLLQSNRSKIDSINKKLSPKQDIESISESLRQLLKEKSITKSKLDSLKNEITSVEEELKQQEKQIENASDQLQKNNTLLDNIDDNQELKEELELFMKKFSIKDISELTKLKK